MLDPLTSAGSIIPEVSPIGDIEVGHDDESGSIFNQMIAYTVWFSANDPDVFGLLTIRLGQAKIVFSDVSSTWMSEHPSVAFVGGADRWVIAFQRNSAANTFSRIWLWLHDKNNTSPTGGSLLVLSHPGGATSRYPDVGGTAADSSGTHALVVYQADITSNNSNTTHSEVWGALVDASSKTVKLPTLLADLPVGSLFDREHPAVNQQSAGGNASWVTAWQERNVPLVGPVIRAQRITSTGARAAMATISGTGAPTHTVRPCIDGRDGRYRAAYVRSSSTSAGAGPVIEVARFDADENQSQITGRRHNVIGSVPSGSLGEAAIRYDFLTRSHWALAYLRRTAFGPSSVVVARVGYTGGIVESAVAVSRDPAVNHEPALTFWPQRHRSFRTAPRVVASSHPTCLTPSRAVSSSV